MEENEEAADHALLQVLCSRVLDLCEEEEEDGLG